MSSFLGGDFSGCAGYGREELSLMSKYADRDDNSEGNSCNDWYAGWRGSVQKSKTLPERW